MKVIKNFFYNLSYQVLVIILPLITVPYVSGILGAEGIGDYAFTFANTQYFIIFGMIGITLYGNRQIAYVREDKVKLKNTFYSIYLLQLIGTAISLILFLVFALVFNKGNYRILYIAQGINILAAMVDISWLFMGLEEFKKTVVRNTIVKLVSLASIFIFVKTKEDVLIYTIILALSAFIGNLTFWLYIPKTLGIKGIEINELKNHFTSAISLFIPQISIQIYVLLDKTLLGIMTDTVEVGYYENSQKLIKMALTIATAVGTVMMPKIANTVSTGDYEKVKYYIKNSFLFVSSLSIPITFGLMGIANELSPWFFKGKFDGIEKLIIISSIIVLAISWSNVLGTQLLVPMNRIKEFTISVTMGAIVNLVLNLILLKKFGSFGACLTTVIAEMTVTSVQFYFVRDFISPLKLIKSVLIFIPSGIIMYLVVRIIGIYMGIGIITTIIQGLLGAMVYLVCLLITYKVVFKQSLVTYVKDVIK